MPKSFDGTLTDDDVRGMAIDGSHVQDRVISEYQYDEWLRAHDERIRNPSHLNDESLSLLGDVRRDMMVWSASEAHQLIRFDEGDSFGSDAYVRGLSEFTTALIQRIDRSGSDDLTPFLDRMISYVSREMMRSSFYESIEKMTAYRLGINMGYTIFETEYRSMVI